MSLPFSISPFLSWRPCLVLSFSVSVCLSLFKALLPFSSCPFFCHLRPVLSMPSSRVYSVFCAVSVLTRFSRGFLLLSPVSNTLWDFTCQSRSNRQVRCCLVVSPWLLRVPDEHALCLTVAPFVVLLFPPLLLSPSLYSYLPSGSFSRGVVVFALQACPRAPAFVCPSIFIHLSCASTAELSRHCFYSCFPVSLSMRLLSRSFLLQCVYS